MIIDYYQLLNIEKTADLNTIKKAFRREIALYHPDKNDSPGAKERFEQLIEAFDILSDDSKRKDYDQLLEARKNLTPVLVEQEEAYEEWQKEARKKSKKYRDFGLDDLLLLEIFVLDGSILEGLVDGLTDGLGDIFDLF